MGKATQTITTAQRLSRYCPSGQRTENETLNEKCVPKEKSALHGFSQGLGLLAQAYSLYFGIDLGTLSQTSLSKIENLVVHVTGQL